MGAGYTGPEDQPEKLGLRLKGSGEPWEGCEEEMDRLSLEV